MTRNFREKKFCFKNDTKHSLFMILVENLALFMGSYFKILPWLWLLAFKMLPYLWVITLNSQRHIYTRPPIGVTPPLASTTWLHGVECINSLNSQEIKVFCVRDLIISSPQLCLTNRLVSKFQLFIAKFLVSGPGIANNGPAFSFVVPSWDKLKI